MAGYRVGAMYRNLHKDLMQIPPPKPLKNEKERQVFYAFMHVRYRNILQRGLKQIDQTIALGERMADTSPWLMRAREEKAEMETALADEKAQMEKMPFTEKEMEAAIEGLKKEAAAAH
jgi:hypothetical protein